MYVALDSLGLTGIEAYRVLVEVDIRRGLPGFDIVGLPDTAVKESRDRVKSAIQNLGYDVPQFKIVANLAPAATKKEGSVYDLPILLALIHAAGYENLQLEGVAVIGEISLSGEIRGLTGVLPMVLEAGRLGLKRVIVPTQNAAEAAVAEDVEVLCATHAKQVVDYLCGKGTLPYARQVKPAQQKLPSELDLADVKGQEEARHALEIAAAGGHNLLFAGSPGSGKSMLARRLSSILPPLTRQEAIETTKIYSVAGLLEQGTGLLTQRPFRAPHHTASPVSLTGGGSHAKPGDISLAHNGVLFLDELPEFAKNALEVLRQPLEDGRITVSRVRQRLEYPSQVMLVAAMNPCPCGYFGHPTRTCTCSDDKRSKYISRVSGPLLDRIDIHIEVQPVTYGEISGVGQGESSAKVLARVLAARERQTDRFKGTNITCNAMIPPAMLVQACPLDSKAEHLLKVAFGNLGMSARGYSRILKVARTIADIDSSDAIHSAHISQAIQLRSLDRKYWGGV